MLWLMGFAAAQDIVNRDPVGVGAGIVLGLPTGITVAYHPEQQAVFFDLALAWGFDGYQAGFLVQGDALVTLRELTTPGWDDLKFPVYLGVGPRLSFNRGDGLVGDQTYFGVRVPVGMSVYHLGLPVEGFLEVGPGIHLVPDTRFFCDIAIGARFYFGPGQYRARVEVPQ